MCIEKEGLEKDYKDYRENFEKCVMIDSKAREHMRAIGMHTELPGFELMISAISIKMLLKYEIDEDIYQMVSRVKTIPSIYPVIKDINPVEQHLKEVLRATGIQESPIDFIDEMVEKISKEI